MLLPISDRGVGRRITLTGETDNRENHFAVSRWSTTKAPLSLIIMEFAIQCRLKGIDLHLVLIPRGQNVEADELSNGVVHRFKMENRVECNIQKLEFVVLNEMLDFAQELYIEADARTARRKQAAADGQDRNAPAIKSLDDLPMIGRETTERRQKRLKHTRLKTTDPW